MSVDVEAVRIVLETVKRGSLRRALTNEEDELLYEIVPALLDEVVSRRTRLAKVAAEIARQGILLDSRYSRHGAPMGLGGVSQLCKALDKPWAYWREEEADAETECERRRKEQG